VLHPSPSVQGPDDLSQFRSKNTTERSGSRNSGPDAQNLSHLPPDLNKAAVTNAENAEKDITGKDEPEELQQYRFRQKPRKRNRNPH